MNWKVNSILITVLIIVLAGSLYFGSGYFKRQLATYTGYSEICVDGVKYLQFMSGATPKYNPNGSLVKCD